ncbi:TPA: hypothetical protein ENS27_09045 [bacterium]|nr:hypothetical protein [bacterium]
MSLCISFSSFLDTARPRKCKYEKIIIIGPRVIAVIKAKTTYTTGTISPPNSVRINKDRYINLAQKRYEDKPRCVIAYPHTEARVEVNPLLLLARKLPFSLFINAIFVYD